MTAMGMSSSNTQAVGVLGAMVAKAVRYIARQHAGYVAYQNTLTELLRLSERDLQDIGFSSSDLRDVARFAAADARAKI